MGIADNKKEFRAFALEADIPALLHKGGTEALGEQLDFSRGASTPRKRGVDIPLKAKCMGHYILSVIAFRVGRTGV